MIGVASGSSGMALFVSNREDARSHGASPGFENQLDNASIPTDTDCFVPDLRRQGVYILAGSRLAVTRDLVVFSRRNGIQGYVGLAVEMAYRFFGKISRLSI